MRILHVVAPGEVGGLERVVHALATGFSGAGEDVHVAALLHTLPTPPVSGHPFVEALRAAGITVHLLALPDRAYLRERAAVGRLCGLLRPDIVHTHGYRPDVLHAGVARGYGVPVVTTVHGFTGGGWRTRVYERLQRRAFRFFDAVVAVSRHLAEQLARGGIPAGRLRTIPNAWCEIGAPLDRVAARRRLGVPESRFHIGWVGRLSREKGPDVLAAAIPRLADLPIAVSFLGDGVERAALAGGLVGAAGGGDRVFWHGQVPEAARLFPAFDVFVLSSRTEGTPIALLEAMAAAVPIVAAGVGGVPEAVGPPEALIVPPENPAALAAAIRAVYDDRAGATERARRARARLHLEFSLDPFVARYRDLYHELRRARPPRVVGAQGAA